jgi:hypothetical protein
MSNDKIMISKEKLVNGYIKNDKGELRSLWVQAAIIHGFDTAWVDESIVYDGLDDALDDNYCFIDDDDDSVDSATNLTMLGSRFELTIEDFTETPSETTKQALSEVKNYTFTSSDTFKRMLSIAKENNLFIQFDGFTQDENDAIVVTHAVSDTEYVVKDEVEFNKLIDSLNVLSKFERG